MFNQFLGRALSILVILATTGCGASAKLTGFRDPALANKSYESIVVAMGSTTLEDRLALEKAICDALHPTRCVGMSTIAPPTRTYSPEEYQQRVMDVSADAVLILNKSGDRSASNYIGTNMSSTTTLNAYASANTYGNTTTANAYGQSHTTGMATPMYVPVRAAAGSLVLVDVATGQNAWVAEYSVSGQGMLNVTDSAFQKATVKRVTSELRAAGLIASR